MECRRIIQENSRPNGKARKSDGFSLWEGRDSAHRFVINSPGSVLSNFLQQYFENNDFIVVKLVASDSYLGILSYWSCINCNFKTINRF